MAVRCDICKAEFEPNVRVRREGGIETTFFFCPGCGQEYAICRTNPGIRKLRQRVRSYRTRIEGHRARGTLGAKHMEHYRKLTGELQAKMDAFNGR
jgi:hypothetical protein